MASSFSERHAASLKRGEFSETHVEHGYHDTLRSNCHGQMFAPITMHVNISFRTFDPTDRSAATRALA